MYKSPISIIESTMDSFSKTIIKQKDDAIFAEIQHSFGVDLDKDELIRALQYDRGQYEKGYADGKTDAVQQWIPVSERLPESYVNVIVCRCDGVNRSVGVEYVTLCDDWSKDYLSLATSVTHWMPMPEPPKEG